MLESSWSHSPLLWSVEKLSSVKLVPGAYKVGVTGIGQSWEAINSEYSFYPPTSKRLEILDKLIKKHLRPYRNRHRCWAPVVVRYKILIVGYFQQDTVFFLQIQEEMLTEGFKRKANELHKEIHQLQKEIERIKDDRLVESLRMVTQIGLILVASRSRFLNRV